MNDKLLLLVIGILTGWALHNIIDAIKYIRKRRKK